MTCPCCGYLTLCRNNFDTCGLCLWTDDGQDDVDAETVSLGPNTGESLTSARRNFAQHLVYSLGSADHPESRKEQTYAEKKMQIMALFDEAAAGVTNARFVEIFREATERLSELGEQRYQDKRRIDAEQEASGHLNRDNQYNRR